MGAINLPERITHKALCDTASELNRMRGLKDTDIGAFQIYPRGKGYAVATVDKYGGMGFPLTDFDTARNIMYFLQGYRLSLLNASQGRR